jgi:Divergent InlB B-repeat domain
MLPDSMQAAYCLLLCCANGTSYGELVLSGALRFLASSGALLLLTAPPVATAEPVSTSPPVVTGTLEPGQMLSASTGTWADTSPIVSYAYQWLRCNQDECTNIDYATANPYTLPWSLGGLQAEVMVTATDARGESNLATSEMTDVIAPGPRYIVSESAVGNGSVTGFESGPEATGKTADANLACPGACGANYPYLPGTEVELSATPAPGSTFLSWGGACSGSAPTCAIALSSDESVTATFSGQAPTSPVLPLGYEGAAGEAQPPPAGPPSLGAWEPPVPSVARVAARLLGIRYRRHHVQAEVECEEAKTCRLSLAILTGTRGMVTRRSFAVAPRRRTRISLTLDRQAARTLARRHRLTVMARLTLSDAGRASLVEQGRFTLTA